MSRKEWRPVSVETYMKWVRRLVPKKTVVYLTVYEYEDRMAYDYDDDYSGPRPPRSTRMNRRAILECVRTYYIDYGLVLWGTGSPRPPRDMKDIRYLVALANGAEQEWGDAHVEPAKDYRARVKEELKQRYQGVAAMIAQKYNVKAGSVRFVAAAKRHFNRIRQRERDFREDPEIRAERWAAATMGGAGRENFFKDNDYSSSLSAKAREDLDGLMDYMYTYFPLTMAEYEERRRKRQQEKRKEGDK